MKTDIKSLRNKYSAKANRDGLDPLRNLIYQFQAEYNAARDEIVRQRTREGVHIGVLPVMAGKNYVNEMLSSIRDGRFSHPSYVMDNLRAVVRDLRSRGPSFLSRSRLPQMIESVIAHLEKIVKAIVQLIHNTPSILPKREHRGRVDIKGVVDRIFYSFRTAGFDSSTNQIAHPGLNSILHLLSDAAHEAGIDHSVVDYIKNMSSQTHFPGGEKEYGKYIKDKKAEFATLLRSMSQLQLEDFAVVVGRSRAW